MRDLAPGSGPTFPAAAPDRRIDGVFGTEGLVVRSAEVVAAPGVERASDHRPLLVTVGVPTD
jgi:endonuclease/exonuclease/phosphatase family metal-dependent hydrolase